MKKNNKSKKPVKLGNLDISDVIVLCLVAVLAVAYLLSPRVYSVTTGLYNQSTDEDQKLVETAMGEENTEERFLLYFQYYNVIHELGHGLIYYNNGAVVPIAEEEQLVNDFAVAYWKYYGEEEKVKELEDIVNYAVTHVGTNYEKGVDYMELGKKNSTKSSFNRSFFNFEDYGWFQFSSVKHSFESDKDLETVLKEMGMEDFDLGEKKTLIYDKIDEETSTQIINDAVDNINRWGLKYPNATHHFDKNPNNNYSRSMVKFLGLFEIFDIKYIFFRV